MNVSGQGPVDVRRWNVRVFHQDAEVDRVLFAARPIRSEARKRPGVELQGDRGNPETDLKERMKLFHCLRSVMHGRGIFHFASNVFNFELLKKRENYAIARQDVETGVNRGVNMNIAVNPIAARVLWS